MANNDLPPGFTLDEGGELPPGFTLDENIQSPQPSGGMFDAIQRYKEGRVNDPSLTPGQKTLRDIIWSAVPTTPGQLAAQGVMTATGIGAARPAVAAAGRAIPALTRILGGTAAGATGSAIDSGDPTSGAIVGGGVTAALEGAIPGAGALARWGTGAKGRIAERLAKDVRGFAETQVPELRPTIQAAQGGLRPMRGGTTAAALEETALGNSGRQTLQGVMDKGMYDATLSLQGRGLRGPNLDMGLNVLRHNSGGDPMMEEVIGKLTPLPGQPYTVNQAEEIIARVGNMLKSNPLQRHITDRDITSLYGKMLNETVQQLPPGGAESFAGSRDKYRMGESLMEMIRQPSARQGGPNRVGLNEPALSKYISENRAELRTKFGPAFDDLATILNRGGQLGTRSIMTPGTGETMSALRQVYGRGQGGAPQVIGSAARTVLPNLGFQSTGRAPYSTSPQAQTLWDLLGISATTGGRP